MTQIQFAQVCEDVRDPFQDCVNKSIHDSFDIGLRKSCHCRLQDMRRIGAGTGGVGVGTGDTGRGGVDVDEADSVGGM